MSITGLPADTPAGGTVCFTVNGVSGPLTVGTTGAATFVSATADPSRPGMWTVCITVGHGMAGVNLESGAGTKAVRFSGR